MSAKPSDLPGLDSFAEDVRKGNCTALSRAITLAESLKPEHQAFSAQLIDKLMPATGKAIRIGITGVPGVGKSTFIEAFGLQLVREGRKVGVLAVDPSSLVSGGSLLGDKTRMGELASEESVFVRPSPSAGKLGGVAAHTREAILLLEAAGFDCVLVETVGAGQSESDVARMVDFFMILLLPGAGDELQGIKKGVLELADMIVVNKAEGENRERAMKAARDYRAALKIVAPKDTPWKPPVVVASGLAREGLNEIWGKALEYEKAAKKSGLWAEKRARQRKFWLWALIEHDLLAGFKADPKVKSRLSGIEADVEAGKISPPLAARKLLSFYLGN